VRKGDHFIIPIGVINRSKDIWGPDADDFRWVIRMLVYSLGLNIHRPDRWLLDLPAGVSDVPGLWANLMTFLGGQRACIGFKFAVLETKALLFHLIRAFEFELAVDPKDVVRREM
jgi:cytochrome P450